ncbi:MAG TPA: SRPBCC domain-containing protein [Reyranella sp.]|nr:SRPBCC domain-containing protein [Reyranella sp.]
MTADAQFTHAHMVRFERSIAATPDKVWSVLTNVRQLPGWYGEGVIEPKIGGRVELMGGHIRGTVTQRQPSRKLAYTWNVFSPGQEDSSFPESYLTLELAPRDGGVHLTLTHLPVLEAFAKLNAMGWHTFLDMVDAAARSAPVEPRETYMKRNAERYGVDLSKLPQG